MIRYLDNQEKVLTKNLWREAFPEDSEEFLTYYDQEKMTTNQVLVREEDGIQAMLHLHTGFWCGMPVGMWTISWP